MKLITRDTDYAIRVLCCMARHKKKVISASGLVKELKVPRPFLRKILQKLNKKKLLKSYKGIGGGFTLLRPPGSIFVTDLIKIFQGPIKLSEHVFKKSSCPHIKTCVLRKKLDRIEERMVSDLKAITVGALIRNVA